VAPGARTPAAVLAFFAVVCGLVFVLPTVFGLPSQLIGHTACVPGTTLAQGWFWTPVSVVNSPPMFNTSSEWAHASGWAPFEAPALINVSNGASGGEFSLDDWTLRQLQTTWRWGAGPAESCPSPQVVDLSRTPQGPASLSENYTQLQAPGATSDVGVPQQFNLTLAGGRSYPSVVFVANYTDGFGGLPFDRITYPDELSGLGLTQYTSFAQTGATFFVVVPFVNHAGHPTPVATYLTGLISMVYFLNSPWYGCVQWAGDISSPFGTGLSFGPGPKSGVQCAYP
jgi:hypothetical protein